jgi:hypothetical protein
MIDFFVVPIPCNTKESWSYFVGCNKCDDENTSHRDIHHKKDMIFGMRNRLDYKNTTFPQ